MYIDVSEEYFGSIFSIENQSVSKKNGAYITEGRLSERIPSEDGSSIFSRNNSKDLSA
jgi:hypothetical protein